MSVGLNRISCRGWRLGVALACVLVLGLAAGCASERGMRQPEVPDQSALDPAVQALDKAVNANAEQFAPRSVDAARRRITQARDILFTAARADRQPTGQENDQVDKLVQAARLDAREALVETQAKAVQNQLDQLQQQARGSNDNAAAGNSTAAGGAAQASGNGPGRPSGQAPGGGLGAGMGIGQGANGLGGY